MIKDETVFVEGYSIGFLEGMYYAINKDNRSMFINPTEADKVLMQSDISIKAFDAVKKWRNKEEPTK